MHQKIAARFKGVGLGWPTPDPLAHTPFHALDTNSQIRIILDLIMFYSKLTEFFDELLDAGSEALHP